MVMNFWFHKIQGISSLVKKLLSVSQEQLYFMQYVDGVVKGKGKGKAIPVTGCGGPQGCETSRLPHFLDSSLPPGP
jgi:hypothetical protein